VTEYSEGPDCYPHPKEGGKVATIESESARAGTDPADHPAWHWWHCGLHGTWHRGHAPEGATHEGRHYRDRVAAVPDV
jgi:hypothetical protein